MRFDTLIALSFDFPGPFQTPSVRTFLSRLGPLRKGQEEAHYQDGVGLSPTQLRTDRTAGVRMGP